MAVNSPMLLEGDREAQSGQIPCPRMTGKSRNFTGALVAVGVASLGGVEIAEEVEGAAARPQPSTPLSAARHSWGCRREDPCPSGVPHPPHEQP